MRATTVTILALIGVVGVLAATAFAVSIETVPVGNPGNAGELSGSGAGGYGPDRICGAVAYEYRIGKYEVTAGQYCEFLNAVAKTDPYGLYNTSMWSSIYGCKIQRSGTSGSYAYSVAADGVNRPVNCVSYWNACRFANWLHNGQPTGAQGAGTTETGAYTLSGYIGTHGGTIQRNAGSKWAVPSEDEWYKAAYYRGGSTNAGYWDYPPRSDISPGADMTDVSANNANYRTFNDPYPIDPPSYTTVVGEFQNSSSPYGTFDQGGNTYEWTEALVVGADRGLRGGSFNNEANHMLASHRNYYTPLYANGNFGFRVVQVPEPGTASLLAIGGFMVMVRRTRRMGSPIVSAVLVLFVLSVTSTRAVNIETVPVENAGNAPDNTGYGAVSYAYSIGKYEVTVGQYCEFLNAVAQTDTYGLYDVLMDLANTPAACGIKRSGTSGSYAYSAQTSANRPVTMVSYWDACRFANWLHNGQPTGAQGPGTTQTGAYTLNDGGSRTPNARWVVPSENEWYKAAYHENDGVTGNYWDYPTASDVINTSMANYGNSIGWPIGVGSYAYPSPYGTFDQGGNVWEWNDTILSGSLRVLRGGFFNGPADGQELRASYRYYNIAYYPDDSNTTIGFRVAFIPEPDGDGDGVPDVSDNCPNVANTDQADSDTDTVGDACDNCPYTYNSNQANGDGDSLGDVCDPPIVAWRSVRFHTIGGGLGFDLSIPMDSVATGSSSTGPAIETRKGGIQRIEVDFDRVVVLTQPPAIEAEDTATGATYPATSTDLTNDNKTLVVEFAGGLPDKFCYRINLADHVVDLAGDTDCLIRALAGDVNGDGFVNLGDMLLAKSKIGQQVMPDNVRFDVITDAAINLGDILAVKSLIGGTVACP